MELFRFKRDIPFMKYGKLTTFISLATFILAVFFLATKGLNYSVEFTGGTVMEVEYAQAAEVDKVRDSLNSLQLGEIQVQALGTNKHLMIRLPNKAGTTSAQLSNQTMDILKKQDASAKLRQVEFIGPQVIILGCFALFQWEFSLTVLAGVLAVLGYSVNESVVVFDRIRENFRKGAMRNHTVPEVIDNAITATMSRTIITHGSTEAMVISMLLFGGAALHGFSMALTIGIVFGVYSSVLVASPLLLLFGLSRENIARVREKKEEAVV